MNNQTNVSIWSDFVADTVKGFEDAWAEANGFEPQAKEKNREQYESVPCDDIAKFFDELFDEVIGDLEKTNPDFNSLPELDNADLYFLENAAMHAMQGLLASETPGNENVMCGGYISYTPEEVARISYNIAEAMLEEKKKRYG